MSGKYSDQSARGAAGVSLRRSVFTVLAAFAALADRAAAQSPASLAPSATALEAQAIVKRVKVLVEDGAGAALARKAHAPGDSEKGARAARPVALDSAWIERQFADNGLIGAEYDPARTAALLTDINQTFAQNGYINSGVLLEGGPDAEGALPVRLVQGGLAPGGDGLKVEWANGRRKGLKPRYIEARLPGLRQKPLNVGAVEREFRLLAADDAIEVVSTSIEPGGAPGSAIANIKVRPKNRYDLYLTASNSRSPSVGGERAALGGSVRNALLAGDVAAAEFGVTEGLRDASLIYETPIGSGRWGLDLRASANDAEVVEPALRPLEISSKSMSGDIGLRRKVIATPLAKRDGDGPRAGLGRMLDVGARASVVSTETRLLGRPFSFSPGAVDGKTDITVARAFAEGEVRGDRFVVSGAVTASSIVQGSGDSPAAGVATPDAGATFAAFQLGAARRMNNSGLELRARAAGQLASGPLYSTERFPVGGESTVRGYRESLLLGDSGAVASVELAQRFNFGAAPGRDDWRVVVVSTFADAGIVKLETGATPKPDSISSVGVALAWSPISALSIRASYASAFESTKTVGERSLQDEGVNFRVTLRPLALRRNRN
ncbi:MAG: ShlB/FhaC/HecB family hemolysin secretion/activation protein [Caulobacterales bacterium]